MKFSPLNLHFDGPSLDFLGSMKPAHESIKEQYPRKNCYFTIVGQPSSKRLQIGMGMLPITTSTMSFSVVSTSMTLKDPELPK